MTTQQLIDAYWDSKPHHPLEWTAGGRVLPCGCTLIDYTAGNTTYRIGEIQPVMMWEGDCRGYKAGFFGLFTRYHGKAV